MAGANKGRNKSSNGRRKALQAVGAVVVLVGLLLPLFTVRFDPPRGFAILYGHRLHAFFDRVTGLKFATTAHWTHILPAVVTLLSVGIIAPWVVLLCRVRTGQINAVELQATGIKGIIGLLLKAWGKIATDADTAASSGHRGMKGATSWLWFRYRGLARRVDFDGLTFLYALASVVVAVGWLVVLALVVLIGVPAMPPNGEKGILPAFQAAPFSHESAARNAWVEPHHLAAALGVGWLVLLIGIAVGAAGMFRQVAVTALVLFILLIVLRFADRSAFDAVSPFLS